jgi:hypothetical protein
MHYYNAKSKVIMKGGGSRGVRRSRRGGQGVIDIMSGEPGRQIEFGGGKGIAANPVFFGDSRGGANQPLEYLGLYGGASRGVRRVRGVRGVRRSRRGGWVWEGWV